MGINLHPFLVHVLQHWRRLFLTSCFHRIYFSDFGMCPREAFKTWPLQSLNNLSGSNICWAANLKECILHPAPSDSDYKWRGWWDARETIWVSYDGGLEFRNYTLPTYRSMFQRQPEMWLVASNINTKKEWKTKAAVLWESALLSPQPISIISVLKATVETFGASVTLCVFT